MINETTRAAAQEVYDYILTNPEKHSQENWVVCSDEQINKISTLCNTTMCIGGAAVFLTDGIDGLNNILLDGGIDERAGEILGLDESQASILFYTFDDQTALDMLKCVAEGDVDKFYEVYELYSRG